MTDLLWLSDDQLDRIKPYFPLSHGVPRVDDHRVVSRISHQDGDLRMRFYAGPLRVGQALS